MKLHVAFWCCLLASTATTGCGDNSGVSANECSPACPVGLVCEMGACVIESCAANEVSCGFGCIDPLTDAMHCGAKGSCSSTDPKSSNYAGKMCSGAACVAGACDITDLVVATSTNNYDVSVAAATPTSAIDITVTVMAGVTIGSATVAKPAFTTGTLPAGSKVTLIVAGEIIGAGGAGGAGGNGAIGGTPKPCGRAGQDGGAAIELTVPTTIQNTGLIAGGGGGGGGLSGCSVNGGGGGGAGSVVGAGGAAASLAANVPANDAAEIAFCGQDDGVRTGAMGAAGTATVGGAGGDPNGTSAGAGGTGGDLGLGGGAAPSCTGTGTDGPGGAAGFAIHRGAQTITIPDGSYATGAGPIRGPVGP